MDPMFDFLVVVGIERVHIVDADMENGRLFALGLMKKERLMESTEIFKSYSS